MDRRSFIGGAAAASLAFSAAAAAHDHNHAHAATNPHQELLKLTADCLAAGRSCLAHCLHLLAEGDKSMGECARAVGQMLALCDATNELAAQNAALLPALAKLCGDACKACADACKAHIGHHAECRACYDACLECEKACGKITA